ncbi:MAG: hypothetical protein ACK5ME_11030 [Parahaliea sp.]
MHSYRHKCRLVAIVICTLLSVLLGLSAKADEERAKRPFKVTKIPEAGLELYIPARPMWNWEVQPRRNSYAVILSTPAQYYPPTTVEIVSIEGMHIPSQDLPQVAASALETVRKGAAPLNPQIKQAMARATYGDISGYEEVLDLSSEGASFEARSFSGMLPSGRPVSFFAVSAKGQLEHVQPMLRRIIRNIKPLSQQKSDS